MTAVSAAIANFQQNMARLEAAVQRAFSTLDDGIRKLESEPTGAATVWAARKLRAQAADTWKEMKELADTFTFGVHEGPAQIKAAGILFSEEIQAKVSAKAAVFSREGGTSAYLRADDSRWQGDAADAYREVLPDIHRAISGLAATAGEIHKILVSTSSIIRDFWVHVAATVGLCVATMLVGVGVGGPVGLAIGIIAALLEALFGLLAAWAYARSKMADQAAEIRSQNNENKGFPDGRWPTPERSLTTGVYW